ncbi:PspC domain-containing protein [Cellulomonas soli]
MDTQTPDGTAPGGAPEPGPGPASEAGPTGTTPPTAAPDAATGAPTGAAPGQAWAPPPGAARGSNGFFTGVRRFGVVRTEDRWIGGVAGGLARKLGVDPLLARAVLAVSVLLGGLGLVVYGVAWALLPEESDGRIHLEEMVAGRFDIGLLGAFGLTIVGLGRGTDVFWLLHVPEGLQGLAWVLFVGGLIALVVTAVNRRDGRTPPPRPTSPYGPGMPPGPYGPYRPTPPAPSPPPPSPPRRAHACPRPSPSPRLSDRRPRRRTHPARTAPYRRRPARTSRCTTDRPRAHRRPTARPRCRPTGRTRPRARRSPRLPVRPGPPVAARVRRPWAWSSP